MDATLPLQGLDDVQKRPRNGVRGCCFKLKCEELLWILSRYALQDDNSKRLEFRVGAHAEGELGFADDRVLVLAEVVAKPEDEIRVECRIEIEVHAEETFILPKAFSLAASMARCVGRMRWARLAMSSV